MKRTISRILVFCIFLGSIHLSAAQKSQSPKTDKQPATKASNHLTVSKKKRHKENSGDEIFLVVSKKKRHDKNSGDEVFVIQKKPTS